MQLDVEHAGLPAIRASWTCWYSDAHPQLADGLLHRLERQARARDEAREVRRRRDPRLGVQLLGAHLREHVHKGAQPGVEGAAEEEEELRALALVRVEDALEGREQRLEELRASVGRDTPAASRASSGSRAR